MIWNLRLYLMARPHIFVSTLNPLAGKESVTMEDLKTYPYLSFEQENTTLFTFQRKYSVLQSVQKNIRVRDRATPF